MKKYRSHFGSRLSWAGSFTDSHSSKQKHWRQMGKNQITPLYIKATLLLGFCLLKTLLNDKRLNFMLFEQFCWNVCSQTGDMCNVPILSMLDLERNCFQRLPLSIHPSWTKPTCSHLEVFLSSRGWKSASRPRCVTWRVRTTSTRFCYAFSSLCEGSAYIALPRYWKNLPPLEECVTASVCCLVLPPMCCVVLFLILQLRCRLATRTIRRCQLSDLCRGLSCCTQPTCSHLEVFTTFTIRSASTSLLVVGWCWKMLILGYYFIEETKAKFQRT